MQGIYIKLPDIATPPRIELFVILLLLPSAIFITQAGYGTSALTDALSFLCLIAAVLVSAFGLGWAVIQQLLMKDAIQFVTLHENLGVAPGCQSSDPGAVFAMTSNRKSSHGGFLVERDLPNEARPSHFGASSIDQLAHDDLGSAEASEVEAGGVPTGNTIRLFAEAQDATRRAWGSAIGANFANSVTDMDTDAVVSAPKRSPRPQAVAEAYESNIQRQGDWNHRMVDTSNAATSGQVLANLMDQNSVGEHHHSGVASLAQHNAKTYLDSENSLPKIEDGRTVAVLGDPNNHNNWSGDIPEQQPADLHALVPDDQVTPPSEVYSESGNSLGTQEPSLLISAMHGSVKPSSAGLGFVTAIHAVGGKDSLDPASFNQSILPAPPKGYSLVAADEMVAMYERMDGFVRRFGIFFQDAIGREPMSALRRMRPRILIGVMVSFMHKCTLAFVFGYWSRFRKSWTQMGLLVSVHAAYLLYQCVVWPFADRVQQAIETLTVSCQVLLIICFANMMEASEETAIAEKCALGFTLCGLLLMMVSDLWQLLIKLRKAVWKIAAAARRTKRTDTDRQSKSGAN
eukprot:jgi/Ulvmu1/2714/UM014_0171.1